jgi:hypothetical protein
LILDIEMEVEQKNETVYKIEVKIKGVIEDEVGVNRYEKRVDRIGRMGLG